MRTFTFVLAAASACLLLTSCSSESGGSTTRLYEMGAKAQVGPLGYTVFERQWANQLGEAGSPEARIPQNRFLLLRIAVLNAGGGDAYLPNLKVVDDHGKSYEEVNNGEQVPQWIGALRQIKPADTIQGNIIFDVPPQHYKVVVTDEDGKETAYIDLPLSFDATTTDVPETPKKK